MEKEILVVDDELDFVEFLSIRSKSSGYDVISASDGENGLEKAQEEKSDLIILDILMPKIDGYDVISKLRVEQRYRDIPVIMLTGHREAKDIKKVWN